MKLTEADIWFLSPNQLVPHFLMAGWLYEARGVSMMPDSAWDTLCFRLDAEFDAITHPHKIHIERDALATATAQYLTDDRVPLMARGAAVRLMGGGIDTGPANV